MLCDNIHMISHHSLSPEQFEYFTSQKDEIVNLSQQKKRVLEKVDESLNTLKIILDSKRISQEDKDEAFDPSKISYLINSLTQHNSENTNAQEVNKQKIILDLIQKVMSYYESRYKDQKFIIKEIRKFHTLAQELQEIADDDRRKEEASIMYKTRSKMPYPPLLFPEKDNWTALCIWCHQWSAIGNKHEAIKHIRHTKNCSWHKEWKRFHKTDTVRVIEQFIKLTPPMKP